MTATAEELPGADLNDSNRMAETVAYEPRILVGFRAGRPHGKLRHA